MQIAINVNDSSVANQILAYLQNFKEKVLVETLEDATFESYLKSIQFIKDKERLHKTVADISSEQATLSLVDDTFWDEMDSIIESV